MSRLLPLFVALLSACTTATPEEAEGPPFGRCVYVNSFSDNAECKEYVGSYWDEATAADDCSAVMPGAAGTFQLDKACGREELLGECRVSEGTNEAATTVFTGDPDGCSSLPTGCGFAGGEYVPAQACGGALAAGNGDVDDPFRPFEQVCVDTLPGDASTASKGGEVCTWEAISAATEEGLRYVDYASCDAVMTQRPYWASAVEANTAEDDPRYDDAEYMGEHRWLTEQVEATACVCCHSSEVAPEHGTSGWYIEAPGLWIDTVDDDGLAMLAGWIDSTAFGAFPAEDNNGFERTHTGMPTTDTPRMVAFLEEELSRRGFVEADFADERPFGGPLADQLTYEPEACAGQVGVGSDGVVRWGGGVARYVYVMDADAANPGVPPNLDLPDGTIWRLDVHPDDPAIESGIRYGDEVDGALQTHPVAGTPDALVSGREYYLYVLKDIYQPAERCLFEAP